jgi:hypothetical protein
MLMLKTAQSQSNTECKDRSWLTHTVQLEMG